MSSKRFFCAQAALAACLAGFAAGSGAQEPPVSSGQAVVKYQNGSLTIKARHVPLVDVLHAVGRETGARLDIPAEPHEQVDTDLGPGPAREVLASLLKGQGLNYAITGSGDDLKGLQVFILPRSHAADATPIQAAASSGSATPGPVPQHEMSPPRVVPVEHQHQMKELLAQARSELADLPGATDNGERVLDAATAAKFLDQVEMELAWVSDGGTPEVSQPAGFGVPTGSGVRDGNPSPIGGHSGHRPH
jgi:hypothetical protein